MKEKKRPREGVRKRKRREERIVKRTKRRRDEDRQKEKLCNCKKERERGRKKSAERTQIHTKRIIFDFIRKMYGISLGNHTLIL